MCPSRTWPTSPWAGCRGHTLSRTLLFSDERQPKKDDFDWLMIMGGPMNIYQHDEYPWLAQEMKFIRQTIAAGKIVLGICLGAQLLADMLGGRVTRNEHREIGWHPVRLKARQRPPPSSQPCRRSSCPSTGTATPSNFLPEPRSWPRAQHAGTGLLLGRAMGLQFHLESSAESIEHLIINCANEMTEGRYVQGPEEPLAQLDRLAEMQALLQRFWTAWRGCSGQKLRNKSPNLQHN